MIKITQHFLPAEVELVRYNNNVYLFNRALLTCFKVPPNLLPKYDSTNLSVTELLEHFNNEIISKLLEKYILISDEDKEDYLKLVARDFQGKTIRKLVLFTTYNCNLQCSYCKIRNDKSPASNMSKDIAIKAVDFFLNQEDFLKKQNELHFYGGEPLLNKDLIMYIGNYIRKKGYSNKEVNLKVVSNGFNIDKDIINIFDKLDISVTFSFDGNESIHNKYRYSNNYNSYNTVIKAMNTYKDSNKKFGVSCTITNDNIELLPEIVEWLNKNYNIPSIGFNVNYLNNDISYKMLSGKLIEAFSKSLELGVWEDRVGRSIRKFVPNNLYQIPKDCKHCGNILAVSPEGKIGACPFLIKDEKYTFLSVLDLDISIYNKFPFLDWNNRRFNNVEKCNQCTFARFCTLGCPIDHNGEIVSLENHRESMCYLSKAIFYWYLENMHVGE